MGKLLQKLVNGIVPSWLSKVKSSSPESSPKKLLPFLRAGSHPPPSNKSLNTQGPTLVNKSTQQDESNSIAIPPSSSTSLQRGEFAAERHPDEESHHPENVKVHNHHTLQHMLEDDISPTSPQSGRPNFNLAATSDEIEKMQQELRHVQENIHHSQDGDQELALYNAQHQENAYQEMLGSKRKSRSLQSDDEEGEEEEGEDGSGDMMKRWAWKRRKGEKGVMSCELPESICSIVGNGRAVVKQSIDPQLALWESMVEMIVGNGLWELGSLEFLLYCYLSLNEPQLHPIIQSSFLQVLKDLERIPWE